MRFCPFFIALVFSSHLAPAQVSRETLWSGKGQFELGNSVPGVVEIRGTEAFPVLKGGSGEKTFVAAGVAGKGRLIAFAHGSFTASDKTYNQKATLDFLINATKWVGKSGTPTIALHSSSKSLSKVLETAQILSPDQLAKEKPNVYCLVSHSGSLKDEDVEFIIQYFENGGGVLLATTPWAFANRYPDFRQSPGNRILAKAGLYFSPSAYSSNKHPVVITQPIESLSPEERNRYTNSNHPAVKAVRELTKNKYVNDPTKQAALIAEMKQGKTLGARDIVAYLKALQLLNGSLGGIKPTRQDPVTPGKFPIVDAIIEMETHFNLTLPAGMMYAIPAADDYPGKVPGYAPIVSEDLTISCDYKGWASRRNAGGWNAKEIRSTGIYASPGKVITVRVPAELIGKGYEVIIGSYGGGLNSRKQWHRYPRIQRSQPINSIATEISNGFGGLVGIRVPRNAKDGSQKINISGGTYAPYYEHGKTDLGAWRKIIRNHFAPMAELASERIIITVPSEDIREVDDPDAVMELWNEIIDCSAELAVLDRNLYRAERLVFDRQPSAGLLHSGYPVCGHIGVHSRLAVDATKLRKEGFWGFFHEYGHNHQHALWALPGTVETTCNLWSVYVYEELIGTHRDNTHRAISPLSRRQTRTKYFTGGADFKKDWSVWVAFDTYLLVQEAFGWEPFQKVFLEYSNLSPVEWPRNQQEINDQWVIRLSKACGKNLAPYWRIWNLPLTPKVDRELSELPIWESKEVAKWSNSN